MEFFTELFLVALPFFILGYISGKVQNELDRIFMKEITFAKEDDEEENDEEYAIVDPEKKEKLQKWEKELYTLKNSYEEKQVFSHPSQTYICLENLYSPYILTGNSSAIKRIEELENKITKLFAKEIIGKHINIATRYAEMYGYRLDGVNGLITTSGKKVTTGDQFLKQKLLRIIIEYKTPSKTKAITNPDAQNIKKERYVTGVKGICYKVNCDS